MMSFGCFSTMPCDYSVAVCYSVLQCVAVCVAHAVRCSVRGTSQYDVIWLL